MFYPGYLDRVHEFVRTNSTYAGKLGSKMVTKAPKVSRLLAADAGPGDDSGQIKIYFIFNQTGNIMIASTTPNEKEIDPSVKAVFQKVIVFFGAWTAALAKKGKDLYDADALSQIIGASGFFVRMHEEDRSFNYSSTQLTLDTAIITSALGAVGGIGGALAIAEKVVGSLGSQLLVVSAWMRIP